MRFSSSSLPALISACARGLGVTIVTAAWGKSAGLEHVFDVDLPPRQVSIVMNAESRERRAVRVVIDVLLRFAARLPGGG